MPANVKLRPRVLTLLLSLLGTSVQADMNCNFSSPTLNFGAIDVLSGASLNTSVSMTATCSRNNADRRYGHLCLYIGDGSGADAQRGSRNTYAPRLIVSGSNYAGFQIYKNASYTDFWGTYAPNGVPLHLYFSFPSNTQTQTITLYGSILPIAPALNGTSAVNTIAPATYSSNFNGGHTYWKTSMTNTSGLAAMDDYCSSNTDSMNGTFPFTVQAVVNKNCRINGVDDIDFGSEFADATNLQGSGQLRVACTRTTPYYIGLRPSNGNSNGAGLMSTVATPSNTDQIPYQLRQAAGMAGQIWGNTATTSSAGNGRAGVGTGTEQSYTIYATVASAEYTPDDYVDTVTVTVNY